MFCTIIFTTTIFFPFKSNISSDLGPIILSFGLKKFLTYLKSNLNNYVSTYYISAVRPVASLSPPSFLLLVAVLASISLIVDPDVYLKATRFKETLGTLLISIRLISTVSPGVTLQVPSYSETLGTFLASIGFSPL